MADDAPVRTSPPDAADLPSARDPGLRARMREGARVRVIQQIAARHYAWPTVIEGTIVQYAQKQTGSWYAHSRGEKLWLDRLVIRKPDGEISTLNLDEFSRVEIVEEAPTDAAPVAPDAAVAPDALDAPDAPAASELKTVDAGSA
jgi:hypothetical protein